MGLNKNEFKENFAPRRSLRDSLLANIGVTTADGASEKQTAIPINMKDPSLLETAKLELEVTASGGVGAATATIYANTFDGTTYAVEELADGLALSGVADGKTARTQIGFDALPENTYEIQAHLDPVTNAVANFGVAI